METFKPELWPLEETLRASDGTAPPHRRNFGRMGSESSLSGTTDHLVASKSAGCSRSVSRDSRVGQCAALSAVWERFVGRQSISLSVIDDRSSLRNSRSVHRKIE